VHSLNHIYADKNIRKSEIDKLAAALKTCPSFPAIKGARVPSLSMLDQTLWPAELILALAVSVHIETMQLQLGSIFRHLLGAVAAPFFQGSVHDDYCIAFYRLASATSSTSTFLHLDMQALWDFVHSKAVAHHSLELALVEKTVRLQQPAERLFSFFRALHDLLVGSSTDFQGQGLQVMSSIERWIGNF
jgi:hypothetical protein